MIARYFAGLSTFDAVTTLVVGAVVFLVVLYNLLFTLPVIGRQGLVELRALLAPEPPPKIVDIAERRRQLAAAAHPDRRVS